MHNAFDMCAQFAPVHSMCKTQKRAIKLYYENMRCSATFLVSAEVKGTMHQTTDQKMYSHSGQ